MTLIARVNSLPNKTEMPPHHSKPTPSLDALVSEITHLRSRLLPGAGLECTLYRGALGTHKALTSAADGVLVFWNVKHTGKTLVSCLPHQVAWDKYTQHQTQRGRTR